MYVPGEQVERADRIGLQAIPQQWHELAKIIQAKTFLKYIKIYIPAALPHLASGIRLAAAYAPSCAIVSEWVGSNKGLGFLILNSSARLQTALLFSCVLVLLIMSLLNYQFINWILIKCEKRYH